MEKKLLRRRRSGMFLRRMASAALLMLMVQSAAMAYTVTLKAGRGSGADIVIDSDDPANMAADFKSAAPGQFWIEGGELWYKFPNCPDTFSAPTGEVFQGWTVNSEDGSVCSPGTFYTITGDITLYAKWGVEQFEWGDKENNFKFTVTSKSPNEVKLIEVNIRRNSDVDIPTDVRYNGEKYAVTEIADGTGQDNSDITALTIPATVRHIGNLSFKGCNNLTTLTFAEGSQLESIGENIFYCCPYLTTINGIPSNVKSPNSGPPFDGSSLQHVTMVGHGPLSNSLYYRLFWGATVQLTVPANEAGGAKWTTFYCYDNNFQADEATTVYKAKLYGSTLLLHKVSDRILKRREGYILQSSGNPVLTKTDAGSTDQSSNDLRGTGKDNILSAGRYVLFDGAEGLGFYPYSEEYLKPGEAYIDIPSDADVNGFIEMEGASGNGGTDIRCMTEQKALQEDAVPWFTTDGRTLLKEPKHSGIYIKEGRKVVIK